MAGARTAQEIDCRPSAGCRALAVLLPLVIFGLLNACSSESIEQQAAADAIPPSQPANFNAIATGSTSVNLSWSASTDNVGVTGYVVRRDGNQIGTPAAPGFADSGLSAATTYSYTVAARDAAGNTSALASASFTTASDAIPPSQPANFNAVATGSTSINLSWTASTDNVGVTGYVVRRDGSQIGTPATPGFADSGLSAATSYSYTVAARDAAGNTSTPASASATTPSPPPPPPPPVASTYYVATTGSNSNSCTAAQNALTPKQTIQAGLGCLAPGSTLVIRDGTYSGTANALVGALPKGSPGNYITIKAENEGNVIITAGLDLAHTNAYLIFQGLRFQDSEGHGIAGNHLKFFRNEFKGGCASGNCSNTGVGTNDFNDTADILFEDNWWHGLGGRYNLLIYNANRVVVRRGVIRHDGGWTDTKGDPEAGLNFYNSSDCSAQNVVIIDNDLTYKEWQGAFYSVYNSASPNATLNNSWYGNIALNSANSGFRLDGNGLISGVIVQDMVMWDTEGTASMGSGASRISVTINRVTSGTSKKFSNTSDGFVQYGTSYTGTVTNVIVANTTKDAEDVPMTYFDSFNNGITSSGVGRVTYSPFDNGLRYLTRIEEGSPLKTAGSGGGQIGAQIVNRIGAPGTLQGEAGWDTDTGVALWPYPNEARIKKEMCTDAGVTRGFCADTSLTNYIMNYLGNGNPYP